MATILTQLSSCLHHLVLVIVISQLACSLPLQPVVLEKGQVISSNLVVQNDTLALMAFDTNDVGLFIKGNNITIDFNHCVILGSDHPFRPDLFEGIGIMVEGNNITIKNARVRGYKIALLAVDTDSLTIEDCDFSYNYRQRLKSTREKEDLDDWLYYHHNELDEWRRYGAAVYLKNCQSTTISGLKITQGQNGIMLTQCNNTLIFNNDIRFNSGIGIGLYRSQYNRIMHNRLDFNVRGYSHGIYRRGQDSAGLLAYEQSSHNIFAYNSATHSGDGFFLWGGQQTMDSGEGGCNDNIIFANDFSYAPTNGIEVTFSSNYLINNKIKECHYAIWGGYSFETLITGNNISGCEYGIAIEHGNNNQILQNNMSDTKTGIKLWSRKEQPADWGFAERRNVASRKYSIASNVFIDVEKPFDISGSDSIVLYENMVNGRLTALTPKKMIEISLPHLPEKMPDGMEVMLQNDDLQGRKYIIVNEWGPYNFKYPIIWLREVKKSTYIFALFGPPGNWKIVAATGFKNGSISSGSFPNTLTAERIDSLAEATIELEFIGEAFEDQWGQFQRRGVPYSFSFVENTRDTEN